MSENAQKPRIRFKGFSDAWEQRKVSELFRVTRGYVLAATQTETTKTDEKPYPVYSSQTKDKGLMGYYKDYLYEDAITWTTDGANAGTVNYRAGKFYCTNVCGVLLSNEVKANQMIAEALNSVTKGYVSYVGNPKLMNNVMADIVIQIPTQAEEREQLSSFFSKLDNLITLHQRKYDKLVAVKKALLEKMFPADGETVPKIRFKGFSDAWEQRKLWQLTIWDKKFNGVESYKQVKVIKYPYVLADVFSQIEDTSGTVRLLSTGSYIGYTTKEKAGNNLCYGEIVAIPWGGVANIKYYNGFFVTADNRIATSSNTQVLSNRYLHWWMESNITQIQSTYRGASIQHPSMNDILSLSIYLPSIEEQEKISNKLDTLDNLITLHQRQLEKLKNIKTALLEKMFV